MIAVYGRLECTLPECREIDYLNRSCTHVLKFMSDNQDAPLSPGSVWVVMFKTVELPNAHHVTPFEIQVYVHEPDENGFATVSHAPDQTLLTLVGPHDGRHAIRMALLTELHAITTRGQLPCSLPFHDARYDHLYAGPNMQRARLVDSYFRHYMGACEPCHARSLNASSTLDGL